MDDAPTAPAPAAVAPPSCASDLSALLTRITDAAFTFLSDTAERARRWLSKTAQQAARSSGVRVPWFALVAVEAPKLPAAPWHWAGGRHPFGYPCNDAIAPRLPSWNHTGPQLPSSRCTATPSSAATMTTAHDGSDYFHELIACQPPLTQEEANYIDKLAKRRCAALLSVDDSLSGILDGINSNSNELDRTYVMLTSDHGFTLGHHGIPREKGFLYEHSLRVPMLVSGPGIPRGVTSTFAGTHIDLAPTILSLANITAPTWMDGSSLLPVMITAINTEQRQILPTVQAHLNSEPPGRLLLSTHTVPAHNALQPRPVDTIPRARLS